MIYIIFLIFFIILNIYILREDLETKYIPLIAFYPFVIFSWIYYYLEYNYLIWISLIILYLIWILYLDIYEYIKWEIPSISKKWSFLDTWIYDYFLYIFVWNIIISELIKNFWNFWNFIILFITLIITSILWTLLLIIHKKKVKLLIIKENLENYSDLDKNLYNRKLQKLSYVEAFKNNYDFATEKQDDLFWEYKNRVPLFLYWCIFIISHVIIKFIF